MVYTKSIEQADMVRLLDSLYDTAVNGVDKKHVIGEKMPIDALLQPVEKIVNTYLTKHRTPDKAAKSFINYQIAKCSTAGFLTGLGGMLSLPIAIPANIASALFIQLQTIVTLAKIGGFDVQSDQVRTMSYMCLADLSVEQVLKQSGIQIGERMAMSAIKIIPCEVLYRINQRVGFCLVTKFGQRGVINLGKTVPIVGGVISGSFDGIKTKQIADRAYKTFIEQNFAYTTNHATGDYYDVEYIEI